MLCYWICGHINVTNGQNKQTNLVYLPCLSNYPLFSKKWCRKLLKKEPQIWKYII